MKYIDSKAPDAHSHPPIPEHTSHPEIRFHRDPDTEPRLEQPITPEKQGNQASSGIRARFVQAGSVVCRNTERWAVPAHAALPARATLDGAYISSYGVLFSAPCVSYFACYARIGGAGACRRVRAVRRKYLAIYLLGVYPNFLTSGICVFLDVCGLRGRINENCTQASLCIVGQRPDAVQAKWPSHRRVPCSSGLGDIIIAGQSPEIECVWFFELDTLKRARRRRRRTFYGRVCDLRVAQPVCPPLPCAHPFYYI